MMVLFDAHASMVEFGRASAVGDAVARGHVADLPEPIQFRKPLPPAAKVEIIISNLGDGLVDVVKSALRQTSLRSNSDILMSRPSLCTSLPARPLRSQEGCAMASQQAPGLPCQVGCSGAEAGDRASIAVSVDLDYGQRQPLRGHRFYQFACTRVRRSQ